jgi:hypothetical protein
MVICKPIKKVLDLVKEGGHFMTFIDDSPGKNSLCVAHTFSISFVLVQSILSNLLSLKSTSGLSGGQ